MIWEIYLQGKNYTKKTLGLKLEKKRNYLYQASGKIVGFSESDFLALEKQDEITIRSINSPKNNFQGPFSKIDYESNTQTFSFTAYNFPAKFNNWIWTDSAKEWTNTKLGTILDEIFAKYTFPSFWYEISDTDLKNLIINFRIENEPIWSAIMRLLKQVGATWYAHPDPFSTSNKKFTQEKLYFAYDFYKDSKDLIPISKKITKKYDNIINSVKTLGRGDGINQLESINFHATNIRSYLSENLESTTGEEEYVLNLIKITNGFQYELESGEAYISLTNLPTPNDPTSVFGADVSVWVWISGTGWIRPTEIECKKGYYLYLPKAKTIDIVGTPCNITWASIEAGLQTGYNFVGTGNSDIRIENNNHSIGAWTGNSWTTLYSGNILKKGHGYWIEKNAGESQKIHLIDTTKFPNVDNDVWIGLEKIHYTEIIGNDLIISERGKDDTPKYFHKKGIEVYSAHYTETSPENKSSIDKYGVCSAVYTDKTIIDQGTLDFLAQRIIAEYSFASKLIDIKTKYVNNLNLGIDDTFLIFATKPKKISGGYRYSLSAGANYISLTNLPTPNDPESIFGDGVEVLSWAGTHWDSPTEMECGKGYYVWTSKAKTVDIIGTPCNITWASIEAGLQTLHNFVGPGNSDIQIGNNDHKITDRYEMRNYGLTSNHKLYKGHGIWIFKNEGAVEENLIKVTEFLYSDRNLAIILQGGGSYDPLIGEIADISKKIEIENIYGAGATNIYQIGPLTESLSNIGGDDKYFEFSVFIPEEAVAINKIRLNVEAKPWRSYEKVVSTKNSFGSTYTTPDSSTAVEKQLSIENASGIPYGDWGRKQSIHVRKIHPVSKLYTSADFHGVIINVLMTNMHLTESSEIKKVEITCDDCGTSLFKYDPSSSITLAAAYSWGAVFWSKDSSGSKGDWTWCSHSTAKLHMECTWKIKITYEDPAPCCFETSNREIITKHSHNVPGSSHRHTIPEHNHSLTHGIYEGTTKKLYLKIRKTSGGGFVTPTGWTSFSSKTEDLAKYFATGENLVRIGLAKSGLGRVQLDGFVQLYIRSKI